jgi:O-methyltransferase
MNSFIVRLKKRLAKACPRLTDIYRVARFGPGGGQLTFSGWGMTTSTTTPPWVNSFPGKELEQVSGFEAANHEMFERVRDSKFALSQFSNEKNPIEVLSGLQWRHYFVYWSAFYAARRAEGAVKNLVECGVCDGLTVFYARRALERADAKGEAYLYDAWEPMDKNHLLETERSRAGDYSYLQVERTMQNLRPVSENFVFNKGFIPESFTTAINPIHLAWLHIDLNSALATEKALEFFYDKLLPGGVVLFDDYSWEGYEDTKKTIDSFFCSKNVDLLHFPTGQALVFKPQSV